MKYFLHDTSAFDDEKITELYLKFGYEGLGLFYTCLEKIGKQEKPIKTVVLKAQLKVGKRLEKCWSFMEEIGIISSSNGETFNEQLLNFSEKYQIKKEKTRKRVSEWRDNKQDTNNVTSYNRVSNARKVKESKVKESKVLKDKEKVDDGLTKIESEIPQQLCEWSRQYFDEKYLGKPAVEVFRKLLELDKYKIEQIKSAIFWARSDNFWSTNFLTPAKLRMKDKSGVKYIDVFLAKILKDGNNKVNSKAGCTYEQIAEVVQKQFGDKQFGDTG